MDNNVQITVPSLPSQRAVAYFRHSSQEQQEDSIETQKHHVRKWALVHGVEIIREFSDVGQIGVGSDERPAFRELVEEWIKRRTDFEYVLCFDASRWGRFTKGHSESPFDILKKHNKRLICTAAGMPVRKA